MTILRFITLTCTALLLAAPALAQSRAADVAQAEDYLQNLDTVKADFTQIAPDGSRLTGTFYLDRPGRLRFEYNGVDDFVVADGSFIYFYDAQLGEQSNAPIGQTLADFILREDLSLTEGLTVQEVTRAGGLLQIEVTQSSDPMAGSLRIGFSEDPFQIKKWRVTDAQGGITEVMLNNLQRDVQLDRDMFYYRDPNNNRQQPTYNQ